MLPELARDVVDSEFMSRQGAANSRPWREGDADILKTGKRQAATDGNALHYLLKPP
jgi:hypothetical protein